MFHHSPKTTVSRLRKLAGAAAALTLLAGLSTVNADDLTIFSREQLIIGARAVINAGSIQSETHVLVGNNSTTKGSVYSNGTAYIRYNATIRGDLLTTATQTLESGVTVEGIRRENTPLPEYELQTKGVGIGCYNLTIPNGYYCNLQPGCYNDITVQTGGKLYLSAGTYNFRTLTVGYNARVYINIGSSQYTTVNVRDYMFVDSYARISLIGATNTPNVNFYTNQSSNLYIGYYASVEGCFTVPHTHFMLYPNATFTGSVNGKMVTIYQDATINGELARDRDGDDVPDVIEYLAGTSPTNPDSKPAVLREGTWQNRTAYGDQVAVYDFSHFAGYEECDAIAMAIPMDNLTGDYTLIFTSSSRPGTLPDTRYIADASAFRVKAASPCYTCMVTPIPLSTQYRGTPREALTLYHQDGGDWQQVALEYVTFGAVYAKLPAEGRYVVARDKGTYLVSTNFTAGDLAVNPTHRFKTIYEAIEAIENNPSPDGDNIFIAKGLYKASDKDINNTNPNPYPYWSLSKNTSIYGGYKERFVGQTGEINEQEPRLYPVTLKAVVKTHPILGIYAWTLEQDREIIIDGFIFDGLYSAVGVSANAGAIEVRNNYTDGPEYIRIRNCVFQGNVGAAAGAVELQGQNTRFFFDNCIFANNQSTGAYATGPSGGAVAIIQVEENANVEAEFFSCVFTGNTVHRGEYSGTIAVGGRINEGLCGRMPVKVVNCTFYKNSVIGTHRGASICNGATYEYLVGENWQTIPAPAVVMNSILFSNETEAGKEVYGISTGNVVYTVSNGTHSVELTEKGISHTAIHDATIGAVNSNIKLNPAATPPVTPEFEKPGDLAGGDLKLAPAMTG